MISSSNRASTNSWESSKGLSKSLVRCGLGNLVIFISWPPINFLLLCISSSLVSSSSGDAWIKGSWSWWLRSDSPSLCCAESVAASSIAYDILPSLLFGAREGDSSYRISSILSSPWFFTCLSFFCSSELVLFLPDILIGHTSCSKSQMLRGGGCALSVYVFLESCGISSIGNSSTALCSVCGKR